MTEDKLKRLTEEREIKKIFLLYGKQQ